MLVARRPYGSDDECRYYLTFRPVTVEDSLNVGDIVLAALFGSIFTLTVLVLGGVLS